MQIVTPSDMPLTGPTGVVPQNGGGFGIVNMNWTYDDYSQSYIMSYGYSDFVVNGTNNSNDYFVNYALSGNAAYASSVTADHKNAIDWQIANASAKAMEAARAAGDVERNAMNGISGPTTFEKVSLTSSLVGVKQTFDDAMFAWAKLDFNELGAVGKVMTSTSKVVTVGGTVIGVVGGGINISEGKPIRGAFDIGMALVGLGGAIMVSNAAFIAGCAWAGPVGWTLIGVSVAYSVTVAFIDVLDN